MKVKVWGTWLCQCFGNCKLGYQGKEHWGLVGVYILASLIGLNVPLLIHAIVHSDNWCRILQIQINQTVWLLYIRTMKWPLYVQGWCGQPSARSVSHLESKINRILQRLIWTHFLSACCFLLLEGTVILDIVIVLAIGLEVPKLITLHIILCINYTAQLDSTLFWPTAYMYCM